MKSCALCVKPMPDGGVDWDDDGKRYRICHACNDEMAVAKFGVERSYEGGGPSMTTAQATAGARKAMGDERYDEESEMLNDPMTVMNMRVHLHDIPRWKIHVEDGDV